MLSCVSQGTRIVYERKFLLHCRNSPHSMSPPCNLPTIPGVTEPSEGTSPTSKPPTIPEDTTPKENVAPVRSELIHILTIVWYSHSLQALLLHLSMLLHVFSKQFTDQICCYHLQCCISLSRNVLVDYYGREEITCCLVSGKLPIPQLMVLPPSQRKQEPSVSSQV